MKRLPIRIRLAVVFVALMSLVLVGSGAFVYRSLGNELDARLRDDLRARAAEIATLPERETQVSRIFARPLAGALDVRPPASQRSSIQAAGCWPHRCRRVLAPS